MDKTTLEECAKLRALAIPLGTLGEWWTDDSLMERAPNIETIDRRWIEATSPGVVLRLLDTITALTERAERAERERDEALARLITESELADMMQIPSKTLRKWRCYGGGPKFVKFGDAKRSVVRYRVQDVTAFVDGCAVLSSADVHNRSRNKERNGGG